MTRLERIGVGERSPIVGLLALADDSLEHVEAHLDDGVVFGLREAERGPVIAAAQAVDRTPSLWELTLVAVDEAHQGRGVGATLVAAVLAELVACGARRVVVATSSSGIDQIGFYQRCGFRPFAVERDHFDPARGYDGSERENGIVIRDALWFDQFVGGGE